MPSPEHLVVVVGTGTEIGKTWWTCAAVRHLRAAGRTVAARKPAQSFLPEDPPDLRDGALLAAATGEHPDHVCPPHRAYPRAMAPPMAAAALGEPPFTVADLVSELRWPAGIDVGFVETAGGLRSPLAADGDNLALIDALRPDRVLLVADAGLGTINLVRLAVDALTGNRVTVALNRFDPANDLHVRNQRWLRDVDSIDVVLDPAVLPLPSTHLDHRRD